MALVINLLRKYRAIAAIQREKEGHLQKITRSTQSLALEGGLAAVDFGSIGWFQRVWKMEVFGGSIGSIIEYSFGRDCGPARQGGVLCNSEIFGALGGYPFSSFG